MSLLELAIRLVSGVLLVAANAFFVTVEFALTRLRALEVDEADLEASPGLRRAWEMTEELEIHLTGCQLGISTTSVILGVVAEPAITELIEPAVALVGIEGMSVRGLSVVLAVVILNLVHKIWGEQAPTYLGVERPRDVAERLAPLLYWWTRIMKPIIYLGDGLAKWSLGLFGVTITRSWTEEEVGDEAGEPLGGRAELKERMGELLSRGEVPEDRREEILQTLEIGDIPIRDVMVPVRELVFLSLEDDRDALRRRIGETGFVRYPVLASAPDPDAGSVPREEVVGVLYLPALFDPPDFLDRERPDLEEVVYETPVLPGETPVSELIDRLQEATHEAALVTGEDGRVVGLVTVTDAFEAIAGDVEDPLDRA